MNMAAMEQLLFYLFIVGVCDLMYSFFGTFYFFVEVESIALFSI